MSPQVRQHGFSIAYTRHRVTGHREAGSTLQGGSKYAADPRVPDLRVAPVISFDGHFGDGAARREEVPQLLISDFEVHVFHEHCGRVVPENRGSFVCTIVCTSTCRACQNSSRHVCGHISTYMLTDLVIDRTKS